MKTLRSILGILCGATLAVVVIIVAESINGIVYKPDDGRTFAQFQEDLQKDMKAMKEAILATQAAVSPGTGQFRRQVREGPPCAA